MVTSGTKTRIDPITLYRRRKTGIPLEGSETSLHRSDVDQSWIIQGIGPRVMLVEEAGQVLEAHILGSLVESVQHLIMIGDPLQLRPNLNNYCEWTVIYCDKQMV